VAKDVRELAELLLVKVYDGIEPPERRWQSTGSLERKDSQHGERVQPSQRLSIQPSCYAKAYAGNPTRSTSRRAAPMV
jgi:hypothetical protein